MTSAKTEFTYIQSTAMAFGTICLDNKEYLNIRFVNFRCYFDIKKVDYLRKCTNGKKEI